MKKNNLIFREMEKLLQSLNNNVNMYKMNDKTATYYAHDIVSSGKKYIVSKMFANQLNSQNDIFKDISMMEVNFQVTLSRFAYNLTRSQQRLFGDLLDYIHNILVLRKIEPICTIPKSYNDLRKLYLDGDLSIAKHVPIPIIQQQKDHSYVSLLDCVADFLIRKDNIIKSLTDWDDYINDALLRHDMHLFVSNRVIKIINDSKQRLLLNCLDNTLTMVPIFITFWSDDFDPNKSIKSNRQSVWIKTVTIFSMNESGEKIMVTYPLSLSNKGADHEQVESLYYKEVNQLRSGKIITMYSRSHKSVVYVHGDIFCIMNDQPERRGNLKLANGNSLYHGRFGYIINFKKVQQFMVSCDVCTKSIICETNSSMNNSNQRFEWRENTCQKCTGWMYHMNDKMLQFKPDKDFPIDIFKDDVRDGFLLPYKIKKSKIEKGLALLSKYLIVGKISNLQAKSYLNYMGLNGKCQENFLKIATNLKIYKDAVSSKKKNKLLFEQIKNDKKNNPEKYEKFKLPSCWYGCEDLSIYPDVPMHLLMLGIMKTIMLKIGDWLRSCNQNAGFVSLTSGILNNVKSMNLEWCKILDYPSTEKFGGWVLENYSAMAKLCLWFYSHLYLLPLNDQYEDPSTNYTTWSKTECEKWLQVRGLSKKGKVVDLKGIIGEYMTNNNIPSVRKKIKLVLIISWI